jgi:hypothetical protein
VDGGPGLAVELIMTWLQAESPATASDPWTTMVAVFTTSNERSSPPVPLPRDGSAMLAVA